jgi:hypothetical protein
MTFEEWRESENLLEIYDAVEAARDGWNAAMLEAMSAVDRQSPKVCDVLINKKEALIAIAEIEA